MSLFGDGKCPSPKAKNGRHQWVKWKNEEHPNTGKKHGPAAYLVFHCDLCGRVKK